MLIKEIVGTSFNCHSKDSRSAKAVFWSVCVYVGTHFAQSWHSDCTKFACWLHKVCTNFAIHQQLVSIKIKFKLSSSQEPSQCLLLTIINYITISKVWCPFNIQRFFQYLTLELARETNISCLVTIWTVWKLQDASQNFLQSDKEDIKLPRRRWMKFVEIRAEYWKLWIHQLTKVWSVKLNFIFAFAWEIIAVDDVGTRNNKIVISNLIK